MQGLPQAAPIGPHALALVLAVFGLFARYAGVTPAAVVGLRLADWGRDDGRYLPP